MKHNHTLLEAKVVVLGSQGVGKSSLVLRYVQKTFSPNSPSTIGAAFSTTKIFTDGCKVRLQIWDTAGQERFRSMAPMYYRGASAAILAYDISSEETFIDLHKWLEELKKNMSEDLVLVIHIVGCKSDLAPAKRQVSQMRAQNYVKCDLQESYTVHEVSAKEDRGVNELFLQLARQLVERRSHAEKIQPPKTVSLNEQDSSQDLTTSSSCCV